MPILFENASAVPCPEAELTALAAHAMEYMNLDSRLELSILAVDEGEMERLHLEWMDEPGPTDVLSFPMDLPEKKGDIVTLGDIVIAPAVAEKQALTAGHSTESEIYILAVHGLLHILEYDHADPDEEKVMFALQEKIVKEWQTQ